MQNFVHCRNAIFAQRLQLLKGQLCLHNLFIFDLFLLWLCLCQVDYSLLFFHPFSFAFISRWVFVLLIKRIETWDIIEMLLSV